MLSSNQDYWARKLARSVAKDKQNVAALEALGWRVLVVWECNLESGVSEAIQALVA